ncbi:MAG: response regulator transcription factor [Pseudomonadota bacterium]
MTSHYRCLIVDDEALGRELIQAHLSQLGQFEVAASCASAIEASRVLATEPIDLLLLDIEMPVLKGTEFYRGLSRRPSVIFTTAYRDYALDGFELEAVDYLLKPITFSRFFRAIERFLAADRRNSAGAPGPAPRPTDWIFVRANRKDIRLLLADIEYVQGLKDYVRIHTRGGVYLVKETMNSLAGRLGENFVRVHRSYLVNRTCVTALTSHDVEIGGAEIPIGETYRKVVVDSLKVH